MPRAKVNLESKAAKYLSKYPIEFCLNANKKLYGKLCLVDVNCVKEYYVSAHQRTLKHTTALSLWKETLAFSTKHFLKREI